MSSIGHSIASSTTNSEPVIVAEGRKFAVPEACRVQAVPTTSSDEAGPGTAPRAAAASGSPASPSPDNEATDTTLPSADGGLLENFKPPTKATLEATDARLDVGVSSPDGAAALLQLSLASASDLDARTVLFDEGKDFSVSNLNSTYVSPTLHVLDPYSYKLPSIADSREAPTPTSQPLAHCRQALNPQQQDLNTFPVAWGTDYIIALIHVSSVISGSEKKAASIRWWNVAFNLARDLKLNQEVESHHHLDSELAVQVGELNCKCSLGYEGNDDVMTEVHREERRRTWWLLFLMDRHLALCYNRPLALLEAECKDLLLPLDDVTWQSGAQPHSHGTRADGPRCVLLPSGTGRLHGPPTVCSGVGLFEFFLPLMTITGHLLDYNRAKNNPVLASAGSSMWTSQEQRILRELDHYQATLDHQTTQPKHGDSGSNKSSSPWMTMTSPAAAAAATAAIPTVALETAMDESETTHIARTVSGYATHVVCVLRILVGSKWDPVCLFEDADFWTSSLGFKDSMSHTMAASECVTHILQHDPDSPPASVPTYYVPTANLTAYTSTNLGYLQFYLCSLAVMKNQGPYNSTTDPTTAAAEAKHDYSQQNQHRDTKPNPNPNPEPKLNHLSTPDIKTTTTGEKT
ncbi:hypothetical protein KCU88_g1585, partial [Aureobasidium melanogenum]